jgi:hypothetical protein
VIIISIKIVGDLGEYECAVEGRYDGTVGGWIFLTNEGGKSKDFLDGCRSTSLMGVEDY